MRGHGREGAGAGWGTDRGCQLFPDTQNREERLQVIHWEGAHAQELWATCHGDATVCGHCWSAPTTTSGRRWRGGPTGTLVVRCSPWTGRAGWWCEPDRCTKLQGWAQGSLLQVEQRKVGCLLWWPCARHFCLPWFSTCKLRRTLRKC